MCQRDGLRRASGPTVTQSSVPRNKMKGQISEPLELHVNNLLIVQPSGELLDPAFLPTIFPPHEHLTEVDRGPDIRNLLLEALEVPGVVDDDKVLQVRECGLLDVAWGGVRERRKRVAERADV